MTLVSVDELGFDSKERNTTTVHTVLCKQNDKGEQNYLQFKGMWGYIYWGWVELITL